VHINTQCHGMVILFLGPHTISFPYKYRTVSAGVELYGSTTKFTNADAGGNGEVDETILVPLNSVYIYVYTMGI